MSCILAEGKNISNVHFCQMTISYENIHSFLCLLGLFKFMNYYHKAEIIYIFSFIII